MRNASKETEPQPSRFLKQSQTLDVLNTVQNSLDCLNEDLHQAGFDDNPQSKSHPYERSAFFTIDTRPTDRASAIASSVSYGLDRSPRLDFYKDNIENRRIILSKTALGIALQDKSPHFTVSEMNSNQLMWAHPLFVDGEQTAAVQIGFTLNSHDHWIYPGNDDIEKIWHKHERGLAKAARDLTLLTPPNGSLTKSLEIAPPVSPTDFVISWDVVNSSRDVLSPLYPIHEAYLETWKAKRAQLTKDFDVTVLDRGDGEHIVVPLTASPFNDAQIREISKRTVLPLVRELKTAHDEIAKDFIPDIFRSINIGVGIGNTEEDQNGLPTGQVFTEIQSLRSKAVQPIFFTPEAQRILFENK